MVVAGSGWFYPDMGATTDRDDTHLKLANVDGFQSILQRLVATGDEVIIRDGIFHQLKLADIRTVARETNDSFLVVIVSMLAVPWKNTYSPVSGILPIVEIYPLLEFPI